MKLTRTIVLGAVAAAVAGTVVLAESHGDETPLVVKARQGLMEMQEFYVGTLFQMASGKVEFDAEVAQRAANVLHDISHVDTRELWVEGTSTEEAAGSRALPAVWENMSDVVEKYQALAVSTEALAENADSLDGLRANIRPVGAACTACHKVYREGE